MRKIIALALGCSCLIVACGDAVKKQDTEPVASTDSTIDLRDPSWVRGIIVDTVDGQPFNDRVVIWSDTGADRSERGYVMPGDTVEIVHQSGDYLRIVPVRDMFTEGYVLKGWVKDLSKE